MSSRSRTGLAALLGGGLRFHGFTASWVAGQLALAATLAAVIGGLVTFVLAFGGWRVPFGQLWLVIAAGFGVQWFLRTLRPPGPAPGPAGDSAITDVRERPDMVARWERRLWVTNRDPAWYADVVRDRLTPLVAERLRQRHGVRFAAQPDRARAILGEELYEFLTAPLTRAPRPAELSRLVTRIEEV